MYVDNQVPVNLGFTTEKLPPGAQICQIYSQLKEREAILLAFVESGLRANERVACLTDNTTSKHITDWLDKQGLDSRDLKQRCQLNLSCNYAAYFDDSVFNPEPMLEVLKSFYQDSQREGQSGARVIVEIHPHIAAHQKLGKLMQYIAKVNLLQEEHPITTLCQYSTTVFDGGELMRVLRLYALTAMHGTIVRNPFFIPTNDFLDLGNGC